jgi:hypothetical protein
MPLPAHMTEVFAVKDHSVEMNVTVCFDEETQTVPYSVLFHDTHKDQLVQVPYAYFLAAVAAVKNSVE